MNIISALYPTSFNEIRCLAMTLQVISQQAKMKFISSVRIHIIPSKLVPQRRCFSMTAATAAAAEVRKLGVIGAGQMVGLNFIAEKANND